MASRCAPGPDAPGRLALQRADAFPERDDAPSEDVEGRCPAPDEVGVAVAEATWSHGAHDGDEQKDQGERVKLRHDSTSR